MTGELYEIKLYNHSGTLLSILQQWNRLEFHQRLNSGWNHIVEFRLAKDDDQLALLRNIIKDYFILVYRRDLVTGLKDLVYEGFHATLVDQLDADGMPIITLYGYGYTQLLKRRVVIPDSGEENLVISGPAETVMKGFVAHECCSGDSDRDFPSFAIEADHGRGNEITKTERYTILNTVVEGVSTDGRVDFGVVGSVPPGTFQFQARPLWGVDHREGNSEGNPAVVFDILRGNMDIPIYTKNASDERNYVLVGGQGVGVERTIHEAYDKEAMAESPWGRREAFADARHTDDDDELAADAQDYLFEYREQKALSFDVKMTASSRWPRDWGLGDLVTARYFEKTFDKQIVEIGVNVTAASSAQQTEVINVEIEDYVES